MDYRFFRKIMRNAGFSCYIDDGTAYISRGRNQYTVQSYTGDLDDGFFCDDDGNEIIELCNISYINFYKHSFIIWNDYGQGARLFY